MFPKSKAVMSQRNMDGPKTNSGGNQVGLTQQDVLVIIQALAKCVRLDQFSLQEKYPLTIILKKLEALLNATNDRNRVSPQEQGSET